MLRSPSKHSSVEFLRQLRADNYISPKGKEYSSYEVDDLYMEKLFKRATRFVSSRGAYERRKQ